MKQTKTSLVGLTLAAGLLGFTGSAYAWIAAGGYHGAYYHPSYYHPSYYHPPYYHPPTGCYGCGAAAGAVAGLAVGAAIASASRPTTVVVQQPAPVYVQQPTYYVQGNLPIGTQVAVLPPGTSSMVVNGVTYYQSGPTWYKPYFGSSGVYYQVVPTP